MISEDLINVLLIFNAIVWLLPPFLHRGLNRYYLLVVAFLFSQSYWTYIPVHYLFSFNLPGSIIEYRIPAALNYSAIAGIAFNLSTFFFTNKRPSPKHLEKIIIDNPLQRIPKASSVMFILRAGIAISILYSYSSAVNYIGVSDRMEFMDKIAPFWSTTLLPINAFLLSVVIAYDLRWSKNNFSPAATLTLILIVLHIFLVGFDGSRRYSLLPLIAMGFVAFSLSLETNKNKSKLIKKTIYATILFAVISTILTLNRGFLVGWQMFTSEYFDFYDLFSAFVSLLLAPMPTIHVNTQMADLIATSGTEGYAYYFYAIGNTLLPKFIFHTYFFGEPLVSMLHKKFGWYGQDFGFLAEAIYAGGATGVIIMHTLFGFIVSKLLNGVRLRKLFFIACAIGLIFGMTNSLRSDFMNLLKASLYSSLMIYFVLSLFIKKRQKQSIQINSGNCL